MVAPLVEALLVHAVRRQVERARPAAGSRTPGRLVGPRQELDALGLVLESTSVLLDGAHGADSGPSTEVRGAGSVLVPALLRRPRSYVVVSHAPADVAFGLGPFLTLDSRTVHRVSLRVVVVLTDSASVLGSLADQARQAGAEVEDHVLARLSCELSDCLSDAIGRRSLAELTGRSLRVVLDEALPGSFLGGALTRQQLDVVDVDWPTEGRGWRLPAAGALQS